MYLDRENNLKSNKITKSLEFERTKHRRGVMEDRWPPIARASHVVAHLVPNHGTHVGNISVGDLLYVAVAAHATKIPKVTCMYLFEKVKEKK